MEQWKPRLKALCVTPLLLAIVWLTLSAAAINNVPIVSSSTQAAISVGTSTPVAVVACGGTLGAVTQYLKVCCRGASAAKVFYNWGAASYPPLATPCATASPAPSSATPSGGELDLVFIQSSLFSACMTYGPGPYGGGNSYLNGELDMVASAAVTCTSETMP